jgi:two-component system, NtrC family, sensor kinase
MNVRAKLLLMISFVALLPLSFLAYTTIGLHQQAFDQKISELHVRSAKYGAKIVEANLERALTGLRPTIDTSIRWAELTPSEREGALWLIYGHAPAVVAVALLDARGAVIAHSAHADVAEPRAGAPLVSAEDLQRLAADAPLRATLSAGLAHGTPLLLSGGTILALPIGFRVAGPNQPWIVLLGFSLNEACAELARERLDETSVLLLDERGIKLCEYPVPSKREPLDGGLLQAIGSGERDGLRYDAADGTPMLAAAAPTPWGFRVLVTQPLALALAPSARMRTESLLWIAIGVLAALGAGLVLARGISGPLANLARGADSVAKGDFSVRLAVEGKDELAHVSASFNRMCGEIEAREREIRAWNEELRARVDDKTAELREAQSALLESRKIAAMAALAAGVAHEINNPLTGVIGLTQVLRARARKASNQPDAELLASIEREALRVRDIVSKMLLLTQVQEARGLKELQPGELLREVLNSRRERLQEAGVQIEEDFAPNLPSVLGDREQMSHVFEELIDNAIKAMRGRSGRLSVASQSLDGELIKLRVADNGRGIAPEHLEKVFEPFFTTKDDWQGQGLGLTAAYRVIEAHHGTIKLDSQLGQGTTVTIALPAKRQGAHLQ